MDKIPSFQKDHDKLQPGFHFSGFNCGVATFDLRFIKPNAGDFVSPAASHSIEHMMATALRNGKYKANIVYFGPMGCRTGFYLLTSGLSFVDALDATLSALAECGKFEKVPGAEKRECGNYLDHDLAGAKAECAAYLRLLGSLPAETLGAEREAMREAER